MLGEHYIAQATFPVIFDSKFIYLKADLITFIQEGFSPLGVGKYLKPPWELKALIERCEFLIVLPPFPAQLLLASHDRSGACLLCVPQALVTASRGLSAPHRPELAKWCV